MENLPSPPQQAARLPPRLAREQLPLCLPPPEPNSLSLTHTAGSADLAPGMDSWCQASQTDQLLMWCGQGEGRERKEVQGLRLLKLEGALEPLTAESETQTREGGHCPQATQHRRGQHLTPVPLSKSRGQFCTQPDWPRISPLGLRFMPKHGMPRQETRILPPLSWGLRITPAAMPLKRRAVHTPVQQKHTHICDLHLRQPWVCSGQRKGM